MSAAAIDSPPKPAARRTTTNPPPPRSRHCDAELIRMHLAQRITALSSNQKQTAPDSSDAVRQCDQTEAAQIPASGRHGLLRRRRLRFALPSPFQPQLELGGRQRPAEVIALREIAAQFLESHQQDFVFHTLGHGLQAHVMPEVDGRSRGLRARASSNGQCTCTDRRAPRRTDRPAWA